MDIKWSFLVKLLRKRVQRHIDIKSVALNVQSVRQAWTRMLVVAYESSGQPLPQVKSEEGHSRSSPCEEVLWMKSVGAKYGRQLLGPTADLTFAIDQTFTHRHLC